MKKLILEINAMFVKANTEFTNGKTIITVTPPINENYWIYRVKLHKDQAIVGFPKFGIIGIGFAKETNWNTNLPASCEANYIYNHIKCNKKYKEITEKDCINAIKMIQKYISKKPSKN